MRAKCGPALHPVLHKFWQLFCFCVLVAFFGSATHLRAQTLQDISFRTPKSEWEVSWLTEFYARDFQEQTGSMLDWSAPPFRMALKDLDGRPGNAAIFVSWTHSDFCTASACKLDVWYWDAPDTIDTGIYRKVLEGISLASAKIGPRSTRGMRDIWVGEIRYHWNGHSYEK